MPEPPGGPGPPLSSSRPDMASRMTEPRLHSLRPPLPSELLTCPQRRPATCQGTPPSQPLCLPRVGREQAFSYSYPELSSLFFTSPSCYPSHRPPPACLGEGRRRRAQLSSRAHTLDFSGGRGLREIAQEALGPGGFATFLSLLCALLLRVCYCLQGYLSLLGLVP